MVSPVLFIVSDLHMEQFEHLAPSTYLYIGLQSWYRYMDGTFAALHADENNKKFRHINAVDPNIKLTHVNISHYRLSFLDCLVTIDTDRTLSVAVYKKDTHTDQYLSFKSNNPLHQKLGLVKTVSLG